MDTSPGCRDRQGHLKTGAEYQLFKHPYPTAGWDDFIFEDDDLKYLLTTTPVPK
ncbi:MAG: hypothetical protein LLG93_04090 [Deltaproteobacteria bacterium]|nr:hypothetical protein [Deltaproteobacteria bacterium]